jgi:O-antigen/teichoic acid export membrane protein
MNDVNPKHLLIKNILSNWTAIVVSVLIGFFMSPFMVHNLGKERYGILALVLSIITYTDFFDVGMRQSLARYLPKYYALRDFVGLNEVANSSGFIYSIIAFATAVGTFVIAFFFLGIFNVSSEMTDVMRTTVIILGLNEAYTFLLMTWSSLGPFHRYDLLNATNIARSILSAIAIVYFISKGYGIITVAVITLSFNVLFSLIRLNMQRRLVPELKFSTKFISKQRIRELMNYGMMSLFIVVSGVVIFSSDNIIVGIFLSASSVTYYSIAGNLIHQLRMLVTSVGVPLVPTVSHFDSSSNSGEILSLYRKLTKYLYYIVTSICVGVFLFGGKFIYLWMGSDFEQTVTILKILIVPACIYFPQVMANSVLLGIGKMKHLLYMLVAEAISKILLSVILVQYWGIYGVAISTAIPQSIIYIFIYPRIFHKVINGNLKTFYLDSIKTITISLLFAIPAAVLAYELIEINGWGKFALAVGFVGLSSLTGFWGWIIANEDKQRVLKQIRRIF